MNKTEPKKTDNKIEKTTDKPIIKTDLSGYPSIISTSELSEIISNRLNFDLSTKKLRSVLRKNNFDTGNGYTKYRFDINDTETINRITELIESEISNRNRRIEKSKKRKSERKKSNETVIRYRNGNVETETVSDNKSDKTVDNKTETDNVNRNNVIDGK